MGKSIDILACSSRILAIQILASIKGINGLDEEKSEQSADIVNDLRRAQKESQGQY